MASTAHPVDHPLDPLGPGEIELAREVLQRSVELSERTRYIEIDLDEPTKDELRRYDEGGSIGRRASIVVRDKEEKATFGGVVSLTEEEVLSWDHLSNAQPRMVGEELGRVEEVVKANEAFREAVKKRGADPDLTIVSGWSAGHDFVSEDLGRDWRLVHGIAWAKGDEDERRANGYFCVPHERWGMTGAVVVEEG